MTGFETATAPIRDLEPDAFADAEGELEDVAVLDMVALDSCSAGKTGGIYSAGKTDWRCSVGDIGCCAAGNIGCLYYYCGTCNLDSNGWRPRMN
jgi:hypothetical protein